MSGVICNLLQLEDLYWHLACKLQQTCTYDNNKTGSGCCHLLSTRAQLIDGTHLKAHILRSKFACKLAAQVWAAKRVPSSSSSNTANAHSERAGSF